MGQRGCTDRYGRFVDYYQDRQGPPMSPNAALTAAGYCNGAPFGAFAGMGGGLFGNGMGGMMGGNPWLSAGFSPGFINGTAGPFGMPGFSGRLGFGMGLEWALELA